ncbi:MAG: AAA family ATPase, partial [Anaerolineales bacterium]
KNAYLVLKFNFSQLDTHPERVETSFNTHANNVFLLFGKKYRQEVGEEYFALIGESTDAHHKLEFCLNYLGTLGHKVYVLIDEYDNFANTILTTWGQKHYHALTHGGGFFRFFFNVLKGAGDQVDSGLGRIFITGVSPVTMDDVTSGFNIGLNISLNPNFNALLGFTEQDVKDLLAYYQQHGLPAWETTLPLMQVWYDNYRFSMDAPEQLFNTDMVLYFVRYLLEQKTYPREMIDQNIRVDYGKLRHLMVLDQQLNGNFSRLKEIMETGGIAAEIVTSFPVEDLLRPENFISLLFYFGLLSYGVDGELVIPNRTVRKLMYGYFREGYADVEVFQVDLWRFANLVRAMAYQGARNVHLHPAG